MNRETVDIGSNAIQQHKLSNRIKKWFQESSLCQSTYSFGRRCITNGIIGDDKEKLCEL